VGDVPAGDRAEEAAGRSIRRGDGCGGVWRSRDPKEAGAEFTRERLAAMAGFFDAGDGVARQMKSLPTGTVRKCMLGDGAKVSGKKKSRVAST